MELDFDYKEGCYLFNGTSFPEVVIHKTIYKLVTVTFQEWGAYKPFGFRVFDLTSKLDIELLNERYTKTVAEQDSDNRYGVLLGTIVEYDYLKLIYLGITDKKILSFVLQRPLLFDYIKARDKYIVADTLDRVSGLQAEFNTTWEQYFRIPIESKENIEWDIISPPVPLKPNVNENLLADEFGSKFTDAITVYDFLNVIDTETFNKIPNQEIKDEISKLIKKTLELAKENDAIGKEDPNKKPKEPQSKFFVELTYNKNGEQTSEPVEVFATNQFDALEKAKNEFLDKYKKDSSYDLLFVTPVDKVNSPVDKVNSVVPIDTAEEIFKAGVEAKKNKSKKTQEQIFKEIEEVDPEDLLSLLDEI
jgi:hypothetical protein